MTKKLDFDSKLDKQHYHWLWGATASQSTVENNFLEKLNTYQNDTCPNCKKEIKALGVDYRVMQNHYICNECDEFFPEISTSYICLKCENKFKLEDARWKSSMNYKIINTQ